MDLLITSAVCAEGGIVAASPLILLTTQEQKGAPGSLVPTGLDWTPWTGEVTKRGTVGALPAPPH